MQLTTQYLVTAGTHLNGMYSIRADSDPSSSNGPELLQSSMSFGHFALDLQHWLQPLQAVKV